MVVNMYDYYIPKQYYYYYYEDLVLEKSFMMPLL
jgi:hypothetical protein